MTLLDGTTVQTGTTSAGDVSTTTVPQPQTQTGTAGTTIPPAPPVAAPPATTASTSAQTLTLSQVEAIVNKALETERLRRQQSVRDSVASSAAKLQDAERRANLYREQLVAVDPEAETRIKAAQYDAGQATRETAEREAAMNQQMLADLREQVEDLGLDPNDTRIAWNASMEDRVVYWKGVLKSAHKIVKDQLPKPQPAPLPPPQETYEQLKERARREARMELGLESVDTSTGAAPMGGDIPTDRVKFAEWIGGMSQAEYEKREPEITAARKAGRIK